VAPRTTSLAVAKHAAQDIAAIVFATRQTASRLKEGYSHARAQMKGAAVSPPCTQRYAEPVAAPSN